jgi:hypothetical protein
MNMQLNCSDIIVVLQEVTDVLQLFQTHCPNLQVLDLSNLRTVAHTTALLHIEKLQEGCQKLRILRITNSQIALSTASLKEQVRQYIKELKVFVRFEDFSDYEEWHLLGCYAMWLL